VRTQLSWHNSRCLPVDRSACAWGNWKSSRSLSVLFATWFIFDFWKHPVRRISGFHPNVYFVWATFAGSVLAAAAVTAWGTGITKEEFLWSAAPDGRVKRLGHGMMLIPTALEVDGMSRKIPRGQVSTLAEIHRRLARWHDVDVTCPLNFLAHCSGGSRSGPADGDVRDNPLLARRERGWQIECKIPVGGGTPGRAPS